MELPRRPLYSELRTRDTDLYDKACQYNKLQESLASVRSTLRFYLRCKRNDILPKSLQFRPPIRTTAGWGTAKRMGKAFLSNFIEDNHFNLKKFNQELNSL